MLPESIGAWPRALIDPHDETEAGEDLTAPRVLLSLLAAGADVNAKSRFDETSLHVAAEAGRSEIARVLLSHGAQPNATERYQRTALFLAAWHGTGEMVGILFEQGADVNAMDRLGKTPLHEAAGRRLIRKNQKQATLMRVCFSLNSFSTE